MPASTLSSLRKTLADPVAWRLSQQELQEWMARTDLESIILATEQYKGRGYYASLHAIQHRSEITALTEMVQKLKPRVVVEIGTCKGGTLYIWCRALPTLERIATIDLPGGKWGAPSGERRPRMYREFLFDKPDVRMEIMQRDSHDPRTVEALKRFLEGNPIDFLFIDADHTYEGVKTDFELYSPLVRKGGMIGFHDIITYQEEHEVHRLWKEIKDSYEHREFIENPDGRMGIGVLIKGQ